MEKMNKNLLMTLMGLFKIEISKITFLLFRFIFWGLNFNL